MLSLAKVVCSVHRGGRDDDDGDDLRAGKPSRYVTSHPGQLSLAIRPWVGATRTRDGKACFRRFSFSWFDSFSCMGVVSICSSM